MPTKTRATIDKELAHHPFELIGKRVDEDQHAVYVESILLDKVKRVGLALHITEAKLIKPSEIFHETPKVGTMFKNPPSEGIKNQYAPYVRDPKIRKLLIEIRNRDLNLQRVLILAGCFSGSDEGYTATYPSIQLGWRRTPYMSLKEFAKEVSSASRFQMIEERRCELKRQFHRENKRQEKARAKADKSGSITYDGMVRKDGMERVQRGVYGVPVAAWVKAGQRAEFLSEQKKRIRVEYARYSDSEDSEDTEQ